MSRPRAYIRARVPFLGCCGCSVPLIVLAVTVLLALVWVGLA